MGCCASKHISGTGNVGVKSEKLQPPKPNLNSSSTTGTASLVSAPTKGSRDNKSGEKTSSGREWTVRPGYSSGASSCSSSDEALDTINMDQISKHSGNVLSSLREKMAKDGDITKSVVRIETPFDTPIEEIYTGVHEGPVLGSGVSGIVRQVVHKVTGVKYAVKCLDLGLIDTTEGLRQLRDEIFIMIQLDHPNIVRIEEVYESPNEIYIVQELCIGGDLFDRLDAQPDLHYSEAQCARLVKMMLSAIRYLHGKGIIHRDLKLENFLFSTPDPMSDLRLIDFGLSKHFEVGENLCDRVGTPYTVAPEIIKGSYDEKCDIWALGVISYLLLCGETPFGGLDGENLLLVKENIMRAKLRFKPIALWETVSEEAKSFVKGMLDPDPKLRPSAKEAQQSDWIQVWSKKDVKEATPLSLDTVNSLMKFKESSDMQKLLSEVLSFTLMPEQIVDLRREFEKIDSEGVGEISLSALKRVLLENAEVGALGALTEKEVEEIFDSIRVRKSEPTIRWHEFLAAGLSQARVDDRNLRLAFDRLDVQRRGFITFDDISELLGNSAQSETLEQMWMESLDECKAHFERITFEDFKKLMKGQPKEAICSAGPSRMLPCVPEGKKFGEECMDVFEVQSSLEREIENPRAYFKKGRSVSYEHERPSWDLEGRDASLALSLPVNDEEFGGSLKDLSLSALNANRALYRKHREMRLAVLEASKKFDLKRATISSSNAASARHAGLIMRRGSTSPVQLEDAHTRALFAQAAKRCGRLSLVSSSVARQQWHLKTTSDVTGMI